MKAAWFWRLVLAAAALCAAPVAAQTTYYADTGGVFSTNIPVTASVGGRCEFSTGGAPNGNYDVGQADTPTWTKDFGFTISCNTASRVAVVSTHGGLKTAGTVTDAGYLGLAPYSVGLTLDGNTGDNVSSSCAVANLTANAATPCAFRGPASSTAGLRLTVPSVNQTQSKLTVSGVAYAGTLVSGQYADTLTVTIAAAP